MLNARCVRCMRRWHRGGWLGTRGVRRNLHEDIPLDQSPDFISNGLLWKRRSTSLHRGSLQAKFIRLLRLLRLLRTRACGMAADPRSAEWLRVAFSPAKETSDSSMSSLELRSTALRRWSPATGLACRMSACLQLDRTLPVSPSQHAEPFVYDHLGPTGQTGQTGQTAALTELTADGYALTHPENSLHVEYWLN